MCFSATASFVASGGLAVIGVESLRLANRKQKAIAAIPLAFAIQQAFEGFQWLSLDAGQINNCAAYGFVTIALLIWPIYIPLVVYLMDKKRRSILKWPLGIGVLIALYYALLLLSQPLQLQVMDHSIYYQINRLYGVVTGIIYLIAVCGSLLLSSQRPVRIFGIAVFGFVMIAALFFVQTFASVWCFFAAALSSLIYLYIKQGKKVK